MNFENYLFRAHLLKDLMTNPRSGGGLSKTTRSYLDSIYIQEKFKREKKITSKYLTKGLVCEEDSLEAVSKIDGKFWQKNRKRFENGWVTGLPDAVGDEVVLDVKTCWDIWSFASKDGSNRSYEFQLWAYMWLTGLKKAQLVYALVDTPEELIVSEAKSRVYGAGLEWDKVGDEVYRQVEKELTYADISIESRVKRFEFDFEEGRIDDVKERVNQAREFLSQMDW